MFRLPTDLLRHLEGGRPLVVPTRQRARAVALAYAAAQLGAGRHVWPSPDVLSYSAWLHRECERAAALAPQDWARVLSAAEEWFLWREAAAGATQELVLLDPGRLSPQLSAAAALAREYGITLRADAPHSEAGLLFEAQRRFTARCRELSAAPAGALAARVLAPGAVVPAPWAHGFDCVPPRLAAFTHGAAAAGLHASRTQARQLLCADAREEQESIASWCVAKLAADPLARLLILFPGPPGERERLAALISQGLDPQGLMAPGGPARGIVAIEGGLPLVQLPLIAQSLTALALLAGADIDFGRIGAWLRDPAWAAPPASERAALALELRERPSANLNLRGLRGALLLVPPRLKGAARELDARFTRAAAAFGPGAATPRQWSERWARALEALGCAVAGEGGSNTQQVLVRWHELLEEFGELNAGIPRLSGGAAVSLLREFAAHGAFRPADDDVAVTISGSLFDPVVIYDGIWVAGLNAQVLPQPVQPDPFLPLAAQRAAGVPQASAPGRAAQAASLLAAWERSAGELVVSAPRRAQDLELLPSPLLATLPAAEPMPTLRWLPAAMRRAGLTETFPDGRGPAWDLEHQVTGGTRVLHLQSTCAFRAFAEFRLGVTQPQTAEPGIAADQRGLLLHEALHILWGRLRNSRTLAQLPLPGLQALVNTCVVQAVQELLARQTGDARGRRRRVEGQADLFVAVPAIYLREGRRAERLIMQLCELELRRPEFSVEAAEEPAELVLAGARLRMRLDRIDRIAQGRVILDYKSGAAHPADWYGPRPDHAQLLAYLCALGEDVAALATVNITARTVRFNGVAQADDLLPKVEAVQGEEGTTEARWVVQQQAWRWTLESLMQDFIAGEAAVDPLVDACKYCHVPGICRILERTGTNGPVREEEADE